MFTQTFRTSFNDVDVYLFFMHYKFSLVPQMGKIKLLLNYIVSSKVFLPRIFLYAQPTSRGLKINKIRFCIILFRWKTYTPISNTCGA